MNMINRREGAIFVILYVEQDATQAQMVYVGGTVDPHGREHHNWHQRRQDPRCLLQWVVLQKCSETGCHYVIKPGENLQK